MARRVWPLACAMSQACSRNSTGHDARGQRRRHLAAAGTGDGARRGRGRASASMAWPAMVATRFSSEPVLGVHDLDSGHRAERDQRAEEVLGQVVAGEVRARRLLRAVLGGELAQHAPAGRPASPRPPTSSSSGLAARRPTRPGRRRRRRRPARGGRGSGSSPRRASTPAARSGPRGPASPGCRRRPARAVMVTVEASGARSAAALPAPPEHDPPAGLDLAEGAGRDVTGGDGPAVVTADPQVDARRHGLPAAQPLGLGDQGEGLVDVDGQDRRSW